ncbi:hypothetical protein [Microbacterium pumilum]|uniref:hypothetical protein n=1 Tax=Microbacterium pumilum TaxID=344165 RepID=UPI0031DA399D
MQLAMGGAMIGAVLAVIARPTRVASLARALLATGILAAAGWVIGHSHRSIRKSTLDELGRLLESGRTGLIVVAVNPGGVEIGTLLATAQSKSVADDVEDEDVATAEAIERVFLAAATSP